MFPYFMVIIILNKMTYKKANDIEKVLDEIYYLMWGMKDWYVYSGVANSGQNRLWQHRFRQFFNPISYGEYLATETQDNITTETGMDLEVEVGLYITENGDFIVTQDNNNWEVE